ncbi:unnamed protein product [Paramecium octaurelia]|uniref:Protein kinase domain-containing protein n=2 Tax=Paramecium octaurelia TaxID=43137 RepID=A0A8S1VN07_PAROT|nr:unnamed protein product [Paramecium octaurelia]
MKLDINCCEDDDILNLFSENQSPIFQGFRLSEKGIKYHKQCKKGQKQQTITHNDFQLFTKLKQEEGLSQRNSRDVCIEKNQISLWRQSRKQLIRELDALISFESDFIVQCYGALYSQGYICIWLEYMNLGTLDWLLQKDGIIIEQMMMMITYKILQGLDYLHYKHKIIHRDIKSHNILILKETQKLLILVQEIQILNLFMEKYYNLDCICQTVSTGQYLNTYVGEVLCMSSERLQSMNYGMDADGWSLVESIPLNIAKKQIRKSITRRFNNQNKSRSLMVNNIFKNIIGYLKPRRLFRMFTVALKQRQNVKELLLSKLLQMAKNINEQIIHQ